MVSVATNRANHPLALPPVRDIGWLVVAPKLPGAARHRGDDALGSDALRKGRRSCEDKVKNNRKSKDTQLAQEVVPQIQTSRTYAIRVGKSLGTWGYGTV